MVTLALLILSGIISGAINAVAGGGAILLFSVLLWFGLPPVEATATLFFATLPGFIGSLGGYKQELQEVPSSFLWMAIPIMVGALIGSVGLTRVDPELFADFIPWLVLSAVLMLAFQARIHHLIVTDGHLVRTDRRVSFFVLNAVMFGLAIYGGFFGVGIGIMMMAVMGLSSRIKSTQHLSALKIWYVTWIDTVAILIFISGGMIDFYFGGLMAAGSLIGGYAFARASRKISSHLVHNLTVAASILLVLFLFIE